MTPTRRAVLSAVRSLPSGSKLTDIAKRARRSRRETGGALRWLRRRKLVERRNSGWAEVIVVPHTRHADSDTQAYVSKRRRHGNPWRDTSAPGGTRVVDTGLRPRPHF